MAVSFASAMFSTLAVWATYLLGSYAYSRWVGLAAAFALAIERDAIGWAAEGWRDDAMMFVFVMSCYAFLRCVRAPTVANAIFGGGDCGHRVSDAYHGAVISAAGDRVPGVGRRRAEARVRRHVAVLACRRNRRWR